MLRALLALLCLFLAGCCDHPETSHDAGADACVCDCPDGPAPEGQVSTYCLTPAHDGMPCCNGATVGTCNNLECVPR